jgi:hypothetical protein
MRRRGEEAAKQQDKKRVAGDKLDLSGHIWGTIQSTGPIRLQQSGDPSITKRSAPAIFQLQLRIKGDWLEDKTSPC